MSRYKKERILFTIFLVLLAFTLDRFLFSYFWIIIPVVLFGLYTAYNAFHLEEQFFLKSIVKGVENQKGIAITFDDGPNKKITPQILSVLEKHKIKASFFCIGKEMEKYPEIIKSIHNAGHTIGSHSYSHAKWIDFNSQKKWEVEINKSCEIVESVIGKRPRFFRPPYGVSTPILKAALKNTKMLSIGWNIRSLDTLNNNVLEIVDRSTHKLQDGCIVLFHDNLDWSCEVLEKFLIKVQELNLKVVPLAELIDEKAYEN